MVYVLLYVYIFQEFFKFKKQYYPHFTEWPTQIHGLTCLRPHGSHRDRHIGAL